MSFPDSVLNFKWFSVGYYKTNRLAGLLAHPTPATQVGEIIEHIPLALAELLVSL